MGRRVGHGARVRRVTTPAASREPRARTSGLLAAAAALATSLAGCGALETPDLAHGDLAGVLVGGNDALAEIYPLGRPELVVRPDAAGRFELRGLPAGEVTLVVYDGDLRAEHAVVQVRGGERERRTWYGGAAAVPESEKVALGGKVVAAVLPVGGGVAVAPRVTARGTTRREVTGLGGTVVVGVLAAGDYQLTAELDGYGPATRDVTVTPGTSVHELTVSPAPGAPAIGCAASGGQCRNGLVCSAADGDCYRCLGDGDCPGGASCDPVARFCSAPGDAVAAVCSACTTDAQCGDPAAGAFCEKPGGAGDEAPGVAGYCTRGGAAPSGPAGFQRLAGPRGERWVAPFGCAEYFEEFGEGCFKDETCASEDGEDGFAGGFCHQAVPEQGVAGYCTAPCAADADCILEGFACRLAGASGQKACTRLAP